MRLDKGEGEKDGGRIVRAVVPHLNFFYFIQNLYIVLSCLIK